MNIYYDEVSNKLRYHLHDNHSLKNGSCAVAKTLPLVS